MSDQEHLIQSALLEWHNEKRDSAEDNEKRTFFKGVRKDHTYL